MVAPVNDLDVHLQAETPRTLVTANGVGGLILSTTANVVTVAAGVGTPSIITLVATPLTTAGTVTFSTSPTVPLTLDPSGLIATLHYSDMGTSSVVVTATLNTGEAVYTNKQTVSQVALGSLGYQGALDATRNTTTQGPIASRPTGADGDFYFATDTLVLYQKVSGAWAAAGNNFTNTTQLTDGANLGSTAVWSGVSGSGKPQDGATVGATLGVNVGGQITTSNSSGLVAAQAIGSTQISDLRTTNYAEDGSGNPTAGAKMASAGTSLKVAKNSLQVGTLVFSDYWFRLVQGIDGSVTSNRIIWRGNNDATTRGGAPDISCLSVTPWITSFTGTGSAGSQQAAHSYTLTPSSYSASSDNLDAIQQIHVQFFINTVATAPFTEFYQSCPSRTYDGASGIVQGNWQWVWWYFDTNVSPNPAGPMRTNTSVTAVYSGFLRVRIANTYGWSATQDFDRGVDTHTPLVTTTITGVAGSSGGGSGSSGGACPAPWVKVRLLNGKEVSASDLHNGAQLAAVNDNNMQALPQGGVVRDLATIWAQRYRLKLADGTATEWSENHRFAVAERGWVTVQNLRGGDHILGLKENVVDSVFAVGDGQVVSFRVEGAGTYFAGGLLCHNTKASF